MDKFTTSKTYRTCDVDKPSQFLNNPGYDNGGSNAKVYSGTFNAREVESLIQKCRNVDALKTILNSAPIGSKDQGEKDTALSLVMTILLSIRGMQIEKCVTQLDADQKDILMRYIYRGFEKCTDGSSAHLLTWHEHTFASTGVGSIVRMFTDRKQI